MSKSKILTGNQIRYIKAPSDVFGYLTPNKNYEVKQVISSRSAGDATVVIIDDLGEELTVSLLGSFHSKTKRNFIVSNHAG